MYAEQVYEFARRAAAAALPQAPQRLTKADIGFLRQMLQDELAELEAAGELADQADALVDLIYYILHIACKQGINLDPLFKIVHRANMAKVAAGVQRRADGKIMKPPDWQPPEPLLAAELERQRDQGAFTAAGQVDK